jgi:hypothetical protein
LREMLAVVVGEGAVKMVMAPLVKATYNIGWVV